MNLPGEYETHIDIFNTISSGYAENVEKSRVRKGNVDLEDVVNKAIDIAKFGGKNQLVIVEGPESKGYVCMNIMASDADSSHRNASLGAVLEMPLVNANELRRLIENDPGIFFRAVKKANGEKPISTYSPNGSKNAEVILGSNIEIFPNISQKDSKFSYQAKLSQKTESAPFPLGYKPW